MALLRKTLAFNHSELDRAVREVLKSKKGHTNIFIIYMAIRNLWFFVKKKPHFYF